MSNQLLRLQGKKGWRGTVNRRFITIRFMPIKKKFEVTVLWSDCQYIARTGMHINNPPIQFDTMFDAACYAFTKRPK